MCSLKEVKNQMEIKERKTGKGKVRKRDIHIVIF